MTSGSRISSSFLRPIAIALLSSCAFPALAQTSGVTNDRLLNPDKEPQNWLSYNRSYDGQRFSPLKDINADTVKNLRLAFSVALTPPLGTTGTYKFSGLEGTPLVVDGHMYLTDGWSRVYGIDVSSGKRGSVDWIMDPQNVGSSITSEPPNNKGVAILGDTLYSLVFDGRLEATKASTGEVLWEKKVNKDPREDFTMAPLIVKNLVMIGSANGDRGGRHWMEARDATTGNIVWTRFTIPAPGEPGGDTWKDKNNDWQNGGGSIWNTPTYDTSANLTYWGTGQPYPDYDPASRPGDNLYANSVLALDADSGDMKWYFQYTPNESWDYDEIGAHILVDVSIGGQTRKLVTHFGRNGIYYGIDRTNGVFVNGGPFVNKITWTKGLDPKTGKPVEYDPNKDVQTYVQTTRPGGLNGKVDETCPSLQGGTNYWPVSYDPQTGRLYAVAMEGCATFPTTQGGQVGNTMPGSVVAVDPTTGKVVQKRMTPFAQYGGTLSTAGGLVFAGQVDGTFEAMDANTLAPLWSVNLGSGISAPAMTYSVNGKQYLALEVGASPVQSTLNYAAKGQDPDLARNLQPTAILYVFTL